MDAVVEAWRPRQDARGKSEITVSYLHETGRMTLEAVSPERYLALWTQGLLKHQQQEAPKPEHLPTPEQVQVFLNLRMAEGKRGLFRTPEQKQAEHLLHSAVVNTGGIETEPYVAPALVELPVALPMAKRREKAIQEAREVALSLQQQETSMSNTDAVTIESPTEPATAADAQQTPETESVSPRRQPDVEAFRHRMQKAREEGRAGNRATYLANFPPLDETARKIFELPEESKTLLERAVARSSYGSRAERAEELGISVAAWSSRLNKIYKIIGIPQQKKRKRYFARVWAAYLKQKPAWESEAVSRPGRSDEAVPLPQSNGMDHAAVPAKHEAVPLSPASLPPGILQPALGGAFLLQPPAGTKEITITIKF